MNMRNALQAMKPYTPGVLAPGKLKLSSNENPLGPSPKAMEAFQTSINNLHLYPDIAALQLRQALAAKHSMQPENFVVGNGSDEVLVILAATFLNPGDHVLVGKHTFSEYRFASTLMAAEVEAVAMNEGRFDCQTLQQAVREHTRAIFLCSPNNPTGTIIPAAELRSLLRKIPAEILIVLDAAYSEYIDDPSEAGYPFEKELLAKHANLIILHTFSKLYGLAGLRIGYSMASSTVSGMMERARQPFNVSLPAQAAAIAALSDEEFVQQSLRVNRAGKEQLYTFFRECGFAYIESQSNFICVHVHQDAQQLFLRIMEHGVTIRPLGSFGLPECIRVTIGTTAQNLQFMQAFRAACGL